MTGVMASLLVDVYPSGAKLTLFVDGNCFLMASTFSLYSLQRMLFTMLVDRSSYSLGKASHDGCSSMHNTAFHGI
jgi:hypothetical protein